MLYTIEASGIWASGKCLGEKLLAEYPCLNDFGFRYVERSVPTGCWIKDEDGYSKLWQEGLTKTVYDPCIEINTIEELDRLIKALKEPVIVTSGNIEIYDSYRE